MEVPFGPKAICSRCLDFLLERFSWILGSLVWWTFLGYNFISMNLFNLVSIPQPTGRGLSLALFEFFGSLVFWPDRGPNLTTSLLTPYMILFLDGLESFFGFIFFPICWRIYKDGQVIPLDDSLDYGANFSHMLGFDSPKMLELMRLYVTIHRFVCVCVCVCVCDVLMKNKKKNYNGRETSCTHS